jgi:hypothetical protein
MSCTPGDTIPAESSLRHEPYRSAIGVLAGAVGDQPFADILVPGV